MIVVDASAVIALLRKEPGHERVANEAINGVMSAVNLAEAYSRLFDLTPFPPSLWQRSLAPLALEIVSFGEMSAAAVARLRPATKAYGLSLGDRACLALAMERALPVLTGDRAWTNLDIGVEVRLFR